MINYDFVSNNSKGVIDKLSSFEYLEKKKIGIRIYKDSFLLPLRQGYGGIIDFKGHVIKSSSTHHIKGAYPFSKDCGYEMINNAILIGVFTTYVWGHCITEYLGRIWFLHTKYCKQLLRDNNARLVFLAIDDAIPKQFKELLSLAGLEIESAYRIKDITHCNSLIVPEESFFSKKELEPRFYHIEYVDTINFIKNSVRKLSHNSMNYNYEKIYLSRTAAHFSRSFRDIGERKLELFLNDKGYRSIHPEQLSVCDQIWTLMHTSKVISTEGSISHNLIFCAPGTNIILLRKADWISMHQLAINQAANLNVTYIDIHHSILVDKKAPWHGPFFIYITKYLKHFFNEGGWTRPYWLYGDYYFYLLRCLIANFIHYVKLIIKR